MYKHAHTFDIHYKWNLGTNLQAVNDGTDKQIWAAILRF